MTRPASGATTRTFPYSSDLYSSFPVNAVHCLVYLIILSKVSVIFEVDGRFACSTNITLLPLVDIHGNESKCSLEKLSLNPALSMQNEFSHTVQLPPPLLQEDHQYYCSSKIAALPYSCTLYSLLSNE